MPFNFSDFNKKAISLPNGNSVSEIPNGSGLGPGVMLSGGENPETMQEENQLRDIIGDILYQESIGADKESIWDIAKNAVNADMPQEFAGNDNMAKMVVALGRKADEDPGSQPINLDTGEQEQTIPQLAASIAEMAGEGWEIEQLIREAKERNKENRNIMSAKKTPVPTTKSEEFKEEEEEDPAKKHKKKANPFKVLMGLVGKMLDHGMERKEIIQKVLKQKNNKWKRETIEKSLKIVKDLRKKEKKKQSSSLFNLQRFAKTKLNPDINTDSFKGRKSIYDIERNIKLMSTMELASRLSYLHGAQNFNAGYYNENLPNIKLDNRKINKDLMQVKAELKRRDYTDEDILTFYKITDNQFKEVE